MQYTPIVTWGYRAAKFNGGLVERGIHPNANAYNGIKYTQILFKLIFYRKKF